MKVRCPFDKLVAISELKTHPKNRNQHPDSQVQRLAQILEYQGWRYPVKVSQLSGYVTSGHGRLLAAQKNGWEHVPVSYQEYESEEQEYADVVADNAIASWSELDLAAINIDIAELGPFDIDLLGIDGFTVDVNEKDGDGDADAVPETPKEAKSKPGELWLLGEHRLLCGDATSREDVDNLMNGERADMIFTDPPYIGMIGVEWDRKDLDWEAVFTNLASACATNCNVIITGQTPVIFRWHPILSAHFTFVQDLVWLKQRSVNLSQTNFARRHENVLWFHQGDKFFNAEQARTQTEIRRLNKWSARKMTKGRACAQAGGKEWVDGFSAQSVLEFGRVYHHHEEYEGHPTQKPTELICYLMAALCPAGGNVVDLFGGSGSTILAAEKASRRAFTTELDPLYCDVILERWAKFTGKDPVREDGTKWSEMQ